MTRCHQRELRVRIRRVASIEMAIEQALCRFAPT
jgi:hypothetical protein